MNLVPLYEEAIQFNNFNGTVLAAGKVEVWYLGRTRKADIYADVAGETPLPNPFDLNDLGMQEVYVNPAFNYTLVVYDPYGAELFSVDKYLQGAGDHTTSNVVVQPSEHIGVSAWTVGEVQIYQPYLVGEVGKTYEGILPIVVNNDVNRISAQHIPLGVQDPLYFVEDSESACIIGFSGQTVPEGVMTESALGFEDNKITGYNGSAFSAGNEYEAGDYISIDNNTISVVNLPTSADVQNIVDVATSGLMPSGDYLTKESADTLYAPTGNYLTGLPDDLVYSADITGLATTAQLDEKLDKADFSTVSGDFLTAIPPEYITENTLQSGLSSKLDSTAFSTVSGDFLTAHQSLDGLMSADLLEISDNKITGYNGTAFAGQGGTANPQIPVTSTSGISIFESGDKVYFNISADYAFTSDLQNVSAEITGMIPAPFDPTYLSGQIDTKLNSAIYAADSGKFLTALPQDLVYTADIQDMATTGDLTAYATVESLTAKQDAGDYLSATDSANFLLTSDSGNFYPMNENPSGYLTAHQSLADYQTTADMVNYQTTAGMTAYLTAIPDTYLQNTDLTITDGKVTEISGVPLSAGDELPSGVMNTSALEYNAVNEISGYNGSAIAQYGAEKQFIVHDDTLCHLSNSAQFALGVNLSAVAQLLGVDETVLYSNPSGSLADVPLSESYKNFKRLKVEFNICHMTADSQLSYDFGGKIQEFGTDRLERAGKLSISDMIANGTASPSTMVFRRKDFNITDSAMNIIDGYQLYWNGTSWAQSTTNYSVYVFGVTGIGRKQ